MLFCILGVLFIIAAGLTIAICHFQYAFYNDNTFYAEIQPNSVTFQSFLNACAFTTSSGLVTDFLDASQSDAFNQMTSIFDGIYSYGQVSTNYSGKTTPTTMTSYYNKLGNFADFSVDDYVNLSPNADKYTTV